MEKFSGKLKFIAIALPILFAILALVTCTSCKVTKYIDKEVTRTDSSVITQNEGLQKTLQETIERYEAEKENWLKTGILFDTVYRNDTVIVNKVTFDNGRIKTIEGRILAINTDLHETTAELYDAHATIDDLTTKLERTEAELSKKQTVLTKEVKRTVYPWWIFALCLIGGMVIQWKLSPLTRLQKFISYYVK